MDNIDFSQIRSLSFETGRKNKFRIRYRNLQGRMCRIPPTMHPEFKSAEEAKEWIKTREAYIAGEKARIQKIKENNARYPNCISKVDEYISYIEKRGVKEHATIRAYFHKYILNFYLNRHGLHEFTLWANEHEGLIKYLEEEVISKQKRRLAPNTICNILIYLNDFYSFLFKKKFTAFQLPKIDIPKAPDNTLDISKSYWTEEEFHKLINFENQEGLKISDDLKDVMILLYHTGLRINELMGLSRYDFIKSNIPLPHIHDLLEKYNFNYEGFICLQGQFSKIDGMDYELKPLKSRKAIASKFFRYIPCSSDVFDVIRKRNNEIESEFGELPDKNANNLLFQRLKNSKLKDFKLNDFRLNEELKEICHSLGLPTRTLHSGRHSFCTNMLMKFELNSSFTRLLSGHLNERSFARYVHFVELINLNNVKSKKHGFL